MRQVNFERVVQNIDDNLVPETSFQQNALHEGSTTQNATAIVSNSGPDLVSQNFPKCSKTHE